MIDANLGIIILAAAASLIIGGGAGFLIGKRSGKEKERIKELEEQLATALKDMEVYRVQVNAHFKKTSELFSNMTDSYKAVYVHLADGSQSLCTTESAMLRSADSEFLTLPHQEGEKAHDDENSKLTDEESSPAEDDAQPETESDEITELQESTPEDDAQPETDSDEITEQQDSPPEDDLHLETVKDPEDFFRFEAKETSEQEKLAQVDEKEEFSEDRTQQEADAVEEIENRWNKSPSK